jgi:2-methylisocitrate lyase-like PEP mutase family enzyme
MTTFAELHHGPEPLLLPNAYDVPSALAFVAAGFPAIGTTSFGVACSLGSPDGGRATRAANLRLAEQLRRLPVLLTVDIEDGYSDNPGEVAAYVAQLAGNGVAGVNIEDSIDGHLVSPAANAGKLAEVKQRNPEVFLNARVDSYWFHQEDTLTEVLERAMTYVEAGADGIFVPGLTDGETIRSITDALTVPVNVLAIPGTTLTELGGLGVRRVSTGSLPYRAAVNAAVLTATAIRDGGTPPAAPSYGELQDRLTAFQRSMAPPGR